MPRNFGEAFTLGALVAAWLLSSAAILSGAWGSQAAAHLSGDVTITIEAGANLADIEAAKVVPDLAAFEIEEASQ